MPDAPPTPLPERRVLDQPPIEPRRGHGGRAVALGLVILLLIPLGFAVWRHYRQYDEAVAVTRERVDFVPTVRVGNVRASDDILSVILPATTVGFETANIYARASGYITKRLVDIGSRVKVGDLLVQITAPELQDQISQAEATLSQAEATFAQTEANRELARVTSARSSALAPSGYASHQQADTDRLTYRAQGQAADAAQATIKAQQAQLRVLRQQQTYQQVVAPFDGVVTQRNIDVGSLVQADTTNGTSLFTMVHSDVIRVQLYVPQDEAFGLTPGAEAVVRVPEIPHHDFPGTVTRIADALQPGTRTLLTEIDVPNSDGVLRSGIYCTVELKIPRRTPSLVVPGPAVIFNQGGLQVAVVENGTIHLKKIDVVRDFGTYVEAASGVARGDMVVLNPAVDLGDGSRVNVRADNVTTSQ